MEAELIQTILDLDERVKAATAQFYNSSVAGTIHDPMLGHIFGETTLSVTDILLVAALSQVHVLLTGPSGRGKTELARLFCQGIFGSDGFFLQKLNPHLTEELFCDIDMGVLKEQSIRKAVFPADFLSLACTVLDECNRTPPALTNVLLGFCDGRIELKCGLKHDVGFVYEDSDQKEGRYHLVIGSINEGKEYAGSFEIDAALSRRLTLRIPFSELRPTPHDLLNIAELRTGHAEPVVFPDSSERLARASAHVATMPLDSLALIYLVYLANVDRCAHSISGFHSPEDSMEVCNRAECRIAKAADGFCPSVGGLCEGVLIFLKRAACGLASLRAARTVRAIEETCEEGECNAVEQLREFAAAGGNGSELRDSAVMRYLESVRVGVEDLKVMLPFVGLGGKVRIAPEYIAKRFQGSEWLAMKSYALETYGRLEGFFRQEQALFRALGSGDAAEEKLLKRLEHAERFTDPAIRWTLVPFLERRRSQARTANEVAEEIRETRAIRDAAAAVVTG